MKYSILLLLVLTSCASIIDGTKQQVSIRTEPDVPATCKIDGSDFNDEVRVPTTVTVQKSYYPVNITCTPDDGQNGGTVKVLSDVSNWGYGGAVLGVGVGAGVDTYTGAAYEYPSNIVVKLGEVTMVGKTGMNSNVDWK